jgi:hypothetical protein
MSIHANALAPQQSAPIGATSRPPVPLYRTRRGNIVSALDAARITSDDDQVLGGELLVDRTRVCWSEHMGI